MVMLTVIRLGDDAYGVPISREIKQQTGREVAFGTVYATIERLQQKGFIRSSLGDVTPERGGRAKRFFRATPAGLQTVRDTKQNLVRLWRGLATVGPGACVNRGDYRFALGGTKDSLQRLQLTKRGFS